MNRFKFFRLEAVCVIAVIIVITMAGCQTPGLMATPHLYLGVEEPPFEAVPPAMQQPEVQVLYATDRLPATESELKDGTWYGHGRSSSLAYGIGTVELGQELSWEELVAASTVEERERKLEPRLVDLDELKRAPNSHTRFTIVDGEIRPDQTVLDLEAAFGANICDTAAALLEHSDRKEVYLFVHGFNVEFDSALVTIAQIWHFMGRTGVPVAYSWPAGRGGVRGYTTDRESGEFTTFHLKQFVRALSACESVEKIHVLAHSRGTDVALTALRELYLEQKGAGEVVMPKFGNLILAAADLDLEVVEQRVIAEGVFQLPERLTIYISPDDRAIGLSGWLFDSVRRLGRLRSSDLSDRQRISIEQVNSVHFIDARVERADVFGHGYFYHHPAVSSDLILVMRDNRNPRAEHGRPLTRESGGFWLVNDDYPLASD